MKNINQLKKEIEEFGNKVWNRSVDIQKICEENNIHFGDWLEKYNKKIQLQTLQEVCEEIEKKIKEYDKYYFDAHKKGDKQTEDIFYNTITNLKELLKKFQGEAQ